MKKTYWDYAGDGVLVLVWTLLIVPVCMVLLLPLYLLGRLVHKLGINVRDFDY